MKLLIDMGNSRLKSAVLNQAHDLSNFSYKSYGEQKPIETLGRHLEGYDAVVSVTLVSVLGNDFKQQVIELLDKRDIALCWVASTASAHGVINHDKQPERLGSDRFVALVAARQAFPGYSCIVIDCGTAVTIDALNKKGEFCGGVIIPGLALWSDSLIKRAGQLNEHQIEDTELFARDTAQAIGSGSIFGLVSAIEGISLRMTKELAQSKKDDMAAIRLVVCGGDAELISQYSQLSLDLIPHLVLMGLAEYT